MSYVSPITSGPPVTGLSEQKEVIVVIYGCESWTIKKVEHRRIDAFVLEQILRVPWTARRSNQSILKEISPGWFFDAKAETPLLWLPHAKS